MGFMRKVTSVSTFGLVDYRSDKERQARYAKQQRDAQREQLKLEKERDKRAAAPPQAQPAGWYPDQVDVRFVRYWDGLRWTEHTQPRQG